MTLGNRFRLALINHLPAIVIEPNYLKPTISSSNRAHGSTSLQCYRDTEGRHWHPNTATPRPRRYSQLSSTTGSRSRGRTSSYRGQLPPQPGGNDLIPDAGPHELPSNSAHSQAQQSQNSTIDPSKVELEGASDGAALDRTAQENATGISHDYPWVPSELPGITNETNVDAPQSSAQGIELPTEALGSSPPGGKVEEPSEKKGDLLDDQPDNTAGDTPVAIQSSKK